MTQRLIGAILIACFGVLGLGGCYESPEPLSLPTAGSLDERLVGLWKCKAEAEGSDEGTILVMVFDERQFYIESHEDDVDGIERFRGHVTRFGRETLLNVAVLDSERAPWIFLRYRLIDRNNLRLAVVLGRPFRGMDSEAARREIERRAGEEALYQDLGACTREEKAPADMQ